MAPAEPTREAQVRVELHTGPRDELRPLFQLAEDSTIELDSYLPAGRVLVAIAGTQVIGHLQLIDGEHPGQAEIKNMAVREDWQRRRIGARLIEAAVHLTAAEGVTELVVCTAAASVGNLRFYQRQGFRMRSVDRDAFGPHNGYPDGLQLDGIPLRDRVWLDRALGSSPAGDRCPGETTRRSDTPR